MGPPLGRRRESRRDARVASPVRIEAPSYRSHSPQPQVIVVPQPPRIVTPPQPPRIIIPQQPPHVVDSPYPIQVISPATTDRTYSSTILRGSGVVPEPVIVVPPPAAVDPITELEQEGFAHQESYTSIRCAMVEGRKAVEKRLRRSVPRGQANRDAAYLHYHHDMLHLKHDYLVEIRGIFHQSSVNGPTLAMEYYPNDLLTYRGNLDYRNQLRVFCEILEGLNALHSSEPPIAHQCLKASNIMIDANGSVKLSLMNSQPYVAFETQPAPSRSYSSDWLIVSRWWSPEVFKDRATISRVENDIWAFGCVMLEVITGNIPYSTFQEDPSLVYHIQAGNTPDSGLRRPPKLKLWKDAVRRCWATPRPTTAYMLNLLCDHLSREVLTRVPDLTGKVARAMNPFIRGHSADIYSGIYTDRATRSTQKSVVIKLVRSNHTAQKTLLGVIYSAKLGPLLVYEHYPGGNLLDYLRAKGESLSFQGKLQIMTGILDALVHLHHDQDIAWGDLHPSNIVLDESGNPKLCGLGPRRSLHHEAASKSDLSVVRYFGPERYLAEATLPDKATDVWAFGCLIVKILTGRDPYREARTTYGVIRAVTSGRQPYERTDCDNLPLWYMASSCWTEGLLQRPVVTSLAARIGKIPTES
ncbi:Receptor-interacting serine/threonine-protein kinase 1 [Ceratobasidium sp. 392]|nr:Receptor-interacting serine/threonine-protein kinase 1 [Ceratobasidium sp. 392]